MPAYEDYLAKLNPAQREAVTEIEGPVLVVAGPGTGKTQVLTMRIAEILKRTQINPGNILALTFTESGVIAMRERLKDIVGSAAHYVDIYTFHSFCNDIIKKWPDKFMFAKDLEPITEVEKYQIMRGILDKLKLEHLRPFGSKYYYLRPTLNAISNLKREGVSAEKLREIIKDDAAKLEQETEVNPRTGKIFGKFLDRAKNIGKQSELADIYEEYQLKLKERGRYDFEDMIMFVVDKLKTDDFLLAYYQEKYQYFLIDEYQDTNTAQNSVVTLLGSFFENPNIFVVGDDDQSIYRFQGASLENILEFTAQYPEAKKIVLRENYRSSQGILDASRSLITKNHDRLENRIADITKELHAQTVGGIVNFAEFEDGNEEAYFIAKKIQELRNDGEDLSEIAVFYRNNADVLDLVEFLKKLDIPYEVRGGNDILADIQIQKIIALLRLIDRPSDDMNFFRILNLDFVDIDREDVYRLTKFVKQKRKHYYDIIRDLTVLKEAQLKNIVKINNLAVLIDQWISYQANMTFAEFFEAVLNESGCMDYILKKEDIRELNRIKSLFDIVKGLNRGDHSMKLAQFLEQIDVMEEHFLSIEETPISLGKSAVQLMTVHKAKGLEFNAVFIFKAIEKKWEKQQSRNELTLSAGIMPMQDLTKHEQEEDERRLFYVALTRARKEVCISYAKNYEIGKPRLQAPTVMISNIENLQKLDVKSYQEEAKERLELLFAKPKEEMTEGVNSYLKELVKDYALSVTALNNYLVCPRKFLYQNVLKVPRVKERHLSFGTAIHYGLQQFFEKFKKEKVLPPVEVLIEEFYKGMEREVMTEKDNEESIAKGDKLLREYYAYNKDKWQIPYFNEYNFLSHKVFLEDIPITGQMDRIEPVDEQMSTVNVVDYKTGRPKTENEVRGLTENSDGDLMRQLVFYKLLGDADPWFKWHIVTGELDFLEKPDKKVRIQILPADVQGLTAEIKEVYGCIQDLKFDKIAKGAPCDRCDFKKICWGK